MKRDYTQEEAENRSHRTGEKGFWAFQNIIQKRTFFVAFAALIAAIASACFSYRAFREAQNQAKAAQDANRIAREALHRSQRAWVGLDGQLTVDVFDTTPRLRVESHYKIKNLGNSPAINVITTGWFESDPKNWALTAKFTCDSAKGFATGSVPQGTEFKGPGPMGYVLLPNQTHDAAIGSASEPWQGPGIPDLKHFAFIGCVAYVDQFGDVHWSRFCIGPDPSIKQPVTKEVKLEFCSLYNDTDDNEQKNDNN
jgi:hypothetical protein